MEEHATSSWQTFNFKDDEGSAQEGMQALRLLLAKLQEAQDNPLLKSSVNNLLSTQDLALTSNIRPQSHVYEALGEEHAEGTPPVYGPFPEDHAPMTKDEPDMPPLRGRKRERTYDRSPKKRRNHSSSDS